MASMEEGSSSSEDEAESTLNDYLPRGSERDVIEYYFYRGLTYRHITLMLEKQHNIIMNQRTLKRRLKDYGLKRDVKLSMMSTSNASGILFYKKYALVLIASMATGLCGMSYALDTGLMFRCLKPKNLSTKAVYTAVNRKAIRL